MPSVSGTTDRVRALLPGEGIMTFRDDIAEPEIRSVFEYWVGKRRDTAVPLKRDIDPVEISHRALPWLFIYRREPNGRLRCILSGTGIVRIDNVDATGRYLDEIVPPHALKSRERLYSSTLEQGLPIYYLARHAKPGGVSRSFARLLLPISATGDRADCVFGIVRFRDPAPMSADEQQAKLGEPSLVVKATPGDLEPIRAELNAISQSGNPEHRA